MKNLFLDVPAPITEELTEVLASSEDVRIERIISHGHASPAGFWYDQQEHEWVMLLTGEAQLRIEKQDQLIHLKPGDFLRLPAHCKHRVEWTTPDEPTLWLAVFYRAAEEA